MEWKTTVVFVALMLIGLVQEAVAGNGIVALQTADPSCADDSGNTYVDCGNGTVTDNRTGLVWLKDANCLGVVVPSNGELDWFTAMEFVAGLSDQDDDGFCLDLGLSAAFCDCGLSDGSSPGEWRLPSASEWRDMVADAVALGCSPTITDNLGTGCWAPPLACFTGGSVCAFSNVQTWPYWSSSSSLLGPTTAWWVNMFGGTIAFNSKPLTFYVWPVRGGQ